MPDYLGVECILDIAMPDDIIERIATMRQANPSSGDLLPKAVAYELFLNRELPDAQGVADQLEEEQTIQMPEMRAAKTYASLRRKEAKLGDSDEEKLEKQIIGELLEMIKASFTRTNIGNRSGREEPPTAAGFRSNELPPERQ